MFFAVYIANEDYRTPFLTLDDHKLGRLDLNNFLGGS